MLEMWERDESSVPKSMLSSIRRWAKRPIPYEMTGGKKSQVMSGHHAMPSSSSLELLDLIFFRDVVTLRCFIVGWDDLGLLTSSLVSPPVEPEFADLVFGGSLTFDGLAVEPELAAFINFSRRKAN